MAYVAKFLCHVLQKLPIGQLAITPDLGLLKRPKPLAPPLTEALHSPPTLVLLGRLLAMRSYTFGHCNVAYCVDSCSRAHRACTRWSSPAQPSQVVLPTCTELLHLDLLAWYMSCQVGKACWKLTLYSVML
jgi:hypothetical protein